MDARTLFRQGVMAIRQDKDLERGQTLLMQSLELEPDNDLAWLWLTHTVREPKKRLEYVERALAINPANAQALALRERLTAQRAIRPITPKAIEPVPGQERRIQVMLDRAQECLVQNDMEGAITQWVNILKIQPDHEDAIRNAVGHLWRLNYREDAKELIWRALTRGTRLPFIYTTAIDIAEREGNYAEAESLRNRVAALPDADEKLLLVIADNYVKSFKPDQAIQFLEQTLETHPDSQLILTRLGDLYQQVFRPREAMHYYDRAARLSTRTKEGKVADKKLTAFVPVLTDRERGSVTLAVREAAGVLVFFLLLGWLDSGLNLLAMRAIQWLGLLLAVVGGYLLVTATSSPQQHKVAGWLGAVDPPPPKKKRVNEDTGLPYIGAVDEESTLPIIPETERYALGAGGLVLLVLAFILVFHRALDHVISNPPPFLPW